MENRSFYNEILTEHNVRPEFKHDLPDADIVLEGVNPSCGDDIFLKLKTDGDTITDGAFVGDGCAISQASADIMLGMIVGKKKEEALQMGKIFMKMIKGDASEEEIDSLEEASALRDIAHMPARVKCAVLGWRTLKEALLGEDADDEDDEDDEEPEEEEEDTEEDDNDDDIASEPFYEVACPNCGETVYVSEDDLDAGEANCAHCGVTFEVALEDEDEEQEEGPVQYEVTCPACGQTTVFEEDDLLDGAPKCPGCGKPLDFEVTEE